MPLGDEKHKIIYKELVNILGEEYVEDDPAVMETFYRDYYSPVGGSKARLEFWVLPGSTEYVQQIYRLANRYQFPVSVSSTGLLLTTCSAVPGYPYWCYIDPKRMNHFSIDEPNMYAIVEPYVTIAQLQAETMKLGLYCGVTGAGAQGSALATHLMANSHWLGWRTGKGRNLLGVEAVLPNGDILRTGTLAITGDDYSWGEGPGMSAAALLRGILGPMGALGMVTRIAMKLYPWPGPAIYPAEGVQPEKKSVLPRELFKTFIFTYPTLESCIEGIRELGEAEIGGAAFQCSPFELIALVTKSREEFWEKWHTDYWQSQIHNGHMVFVILWGYAGARQVEYEEKVLREIVRDTDGEFIPEEEAEWLCDEIAAEAVRASHRGRYMRFGPLTGTGGASDSIYDALRSIREGLRLKAKYTPLLGDGGLYDMGANTHSFWLADFGRIATTAVGAFADKTEECEKEIVAKIIPEASKYLLENSIFSSTFAFEASRVGPYFANVHQLLARIKRALDPNNLANPTRLIDMYNMEKLYGQSGAESSTESPL